MENRSEQMQSYYDKLGELVAHPLTDFLLLVVIVLYIIGQFYSSFIAKANKKSEMYYEYIHIYFRAIEFVILIAAAMTLYVEFRIELPEERKFRNANLIIDIANLSRGDTGDRRAVSPAVKNTLEILAKAEFPMEGMSVPGMILRGASLTDANLTESNFSRVDLTEAQIENANLAAVNFSEANLTSATLAGADLTGADFTCAYLKGTNFMNSQGLTQDMLDSALLFGAPKDNLPRGIEWKYAKINGNAGNKCKYLAGLNLSDSGLWAADLTEADLTGAVLWEANLTSATLTRAALTEATFTRADLTEATLSKTNLTDAKLLYTNLTGADLTSAILTDADLSDADFAEANLTGAIIAGANLSRTVGLTQDMLNSVAPSAPPRNLPDGLTWPFDKNENGTWVRIDPVPASPN